MSKVDIKPSGKHYHMRIDTDWDTSNHIWSQVYIDSKEILTVNDFLKKDQQSEGVLSTTWPIDIEINTVLNAFRVAHKLFDKYKVPEDTPSKEGFTYGAITIVQDNSVTADNPEYPIEKFLSEDDPLIYIPKDVKGISMDTVFGDIYFESNIPLLKRVDAHCVVNTPHNLANIVTDLIFNTGQLSDKGDGIRNQVKEVLNRLYSQYDAPQER